MELRDYLSVLRRHWRLIALVLAVVLGGTTLFTLTQASTYESSVKFFVSTPATADSNAQYTGGLFSQQRAKSYAGLLTGRRLAQAVRDDLDLPLSADDISAEISAQVQTDTVLLSATVDDHKPTRARDIAEAIGRLFPPLVDSLEAPAGSGAATVRITVVEDPRLSTSPVSPRPIRNLAVGLLLGLALGVAAAVARDALDTRVSTAEKLREVVGIATLGAIRYDSRAAKRPLVVQDDPSTPRAEAFRQLRTNLQFVQVDKPLRSLVVTSSLPGEGKSTTACNLAITLAEAGLKVLLLEADLRRPRVSHYLGIEGAVGLTSVLIGQVPLEDAIQDWRAGELSVLPSGPLPPNPSELLGSAGMRDLLREVETRFDLVIVDAPPLLPVTDAAIIGALASGVLLCVHAGKVRRDQLQHAMASLTAVDAVVLGGALTMVPRRGPNTQGYGYGYYGTAGATPVLEEELAAAAAKRPATEGVGVLPAESAAQLQPASLGPLEATRLEPTPLEPTRLEPTRPEPATFEPASFDREPFDPEPFDPVSQDDAPPAAKGSS